MEISDLNIVIGLAGAPVLIWILTGHIKQFSYGIPIGTRPPDANTACSPWPLVVDLISIAWAFALWDAGLLDEVVGDDVELRWTSVVLLGIALGVATSRLYSKFDPRAQPSPMPSPMNLPRP